MSQVCSKCSRANPPDASYCYYDGAILAGHQVNGGPVNPGSSLFPNQFVFPSGQICRNFDQLALACQQNWKAALDLLKQGFFSGFFGGLGRADLALAAQEAARFPDQDRGLDQLLSKLPTHVLENPKLKAEPTSLNLGQVPMGADRQIDLHLVNLGMRLLYGSVVSDCKWLAVGDAPGGPEKLFEFGAESVIAVHVRGQYLRAGTKPLEGKLVIESNGGNAIVVVRAEVPVQPFLEGVLAGAISPRQVAEKALAQPKVAAPWFENGAVADWFRRNGWSYPVQGPSASGLGAVQQFFEALGLAKAPKVEINTPAITLQGQVGQQVQAAFDVRSQEKRPVYAYATCDQPWVSIGRAKLSGRIATIRVRVPTVPDRPGEVLHASIHVTGNGNQRFVVPLTLSIDGNPFSNLDAPAVTALPLEGTSDGFVPVVPAYAVTGGTGFTHDLAAGGDGTRSVPATAVGAAEALTGFAPTAGAATAHPRPAAPAPRVAVETTRRSPVAVHLLPLALLILAMGGIIARDVFTSANSHSLKARLAVFFDYSSNSKDKKRLHLTNTFSFGLVEIGDPDRHTDFKRLTFDERGLTNSTVVKIDGAEKVFADRTSGKWDENPAGTGRGMAGSWLFSGDVLVRQSAEIVAGEPVELSPGFYQQTLDTCLVRYRIENRALRAHRVGLRLLLDTYIGKNVDPTTFAVPGLGHLVDTHMDFKPAKNVPDFVEALEKPSLHEPGTVAHIQFRLGEPFEAPERVSLTRWPKGKKDSYEVPVVDMERNSALVIYWQEELMAPGKTRDLGFSIGLGNISGGLTVGGNFTAGSELTFVSLIGDSDKGQAVTLVLPPELTLVKGFEATQKVPPPVKRGDTIIPSPVTWRVRSKVPGSFVVEVRSGANKLQAQKIVIKPKAIF